MNAKTKSAGDCYIVTGSIGPHFAPRLFKRKTDATKYAREILRHGKEHGVLPQFNPVIEPRWAADMHRMGKPE